MKSAGFLIVGLIFAISTNAGRALEREVHCYLRVDGKTYLDQTCIFDV